MGMRGWQSGACVVLGLVVMAGCSGGSGGAVLPAGGSGQLTVLVHDAPMPVLEEAVVTFSQVTARQSDGTWINVAGEMPITVDLLTFKETNTFTLAADALPAGKYDALVIAIVRVKIKPEGEARRSIRLPNGERKIFVPVEFLVIEGQETTVILDFRVDLSFDYDGDDFEFEPEIEIDRIDIDDDSGRPDGDGSDTTSPR